MLSQLHYSSSDDKHLFPLTVYAGITIVIIPALQILAGIISFHFLNGHSECRSAEGVLNEKEIKL